MGKCGESVHHPKVIDDFLHAMNLALPAPHFKSTSRVILLFLFNFPKSSLQLFFKQYFRSHPEISTTLAIPILLFDQKT